MQQPTQEQLNQVAQLANSIQARPKTHDDNVSHEHLNTNPNSNTQLQGNSLVGNQEVEVITPSQEQVQQQPQVTQEQLDAFNQVLQSQYGVTPEQFQQAYSAYQQNPDQVGVDVALNQLSQTWGVDSNETNRRLQILQQNYGTLLQQRPDLDTIDGAQLLWQQYESSAAASQPNQPTPQSRLMTGLPNKPAHQFTRKQLLEMSDSEKAANWQKIMFASANGLIDESIQ